MRIKWLEGKYLEAQGQFVGAGSWPTGKLSSLYLAMCENMNPPGFLAITMIGTVLCRKSGGKDLCKDLVNKDSVQKAGFCSQYLEELFLELNEACSMNSG